MKRAPLKILILLVITVPIFVFLISLFVMNPCLFSRKTPGSFEYVRRGEEFLDKGKYKIAIGYFEKAYASSPDNSIIKMGLVYAYSKYASSLADSESYVAAIEYLTKAYNTAAGQDTAQNLAIMYTKKALFEAHKGDLAGAVTDFTNARTVASESRNVSKNVSISLFNDAVAEYRSGRSGIAVICLKEAFLLDEEPRSSELLGDIYYKNTELKKASFYWNKALSLNPNSQALAAKLKKMEKETELAKKEEVRQLPHFEIRYDRDLPIDAELVKEVLEKAYFDVGNDLEFFPKAKTIVFIYSQENFRDIFSLPNEVRAFYDGNIRMPLPTNVTDKAEFSRYIYHEYAHAIISAKTNNNCPVWLSEGIAVWEEYGRTRDLLIGLIGKSGDDSVFSIKALSNAFGSIDKDSENMRTYYLVSFTLVKYIIDSWGLDGIRDILMRSAKGQHVMNAIDDEFLLSEKEFEARWRAYVKKEGLWQAL